MCISWIPKNTFSKAPFWAFWNHLVSNLISSPFFSPKFFWKRHSNLIYLTKYDWFWEFGIGLVMKALQIKSLLYFRIFLLGKLPGKLYHTENTKRFGCGIMNLPLNCVPNIKVCTFEIKWHLIMFFQQRRRRTTPSKIGIRLNCEF